MTHVFKNVIHLSPSDIDSNMNISNLDKTNGFVAVYAPWCGHCQDLLPTWQNLAREYRKSFLAVNSEDKENGGDQLRQTLGVNGYPTILEFQNGRISGPFKGRDRSMESVLARFKELSAN